MFVTDCYTSRVTQFRAGTGELVQTFGDKAGEPRFNCPQAMALTPAGRLYVADTFNQRVVAFDPAAKSPAFQTFGGTGTGPGQFTQVHGIDVDRDGNLLVGDSNPFTCQFARVQRFTPAGTYLGEFGTGGSGPGQLACVQDIAQDAAGNLFISDAASRIHAFAHDGTYVRQVAGPGGGDGQFAMPLGLDADGACRLYAVDRDHARVRPVRAAAGAPVTLVFRLDRVQRRSVARFLRAHRAIRVTINITAKDAAGNRTHRRLVTSLRG